MSDGIIIIGAGIAGLSLAEALSRRTEGVTVVDAAKVGSGASGVATSYLEPRLGLTAMRAIEWEALALWPAYAARLEQHSGIDVEFRTEGQVRVSLPANLEKFHRDLETRSAQQWKYQSLSADDLRALEPSLSPDLTEGAFLDNVRWVTGHKVCLALARLLEQQGGRLIEDNAVVSISSGGSDLALTLQNGETLSARRIILCNGLGANGMRGAPADIPESRAVRGVNLVVDQSGLAHPLRHLVKHHRGNLCPRSGGQLIVGTTYEPDITSLQPQAEVIEKLYANAEPILPALRDLPLIEVTAGLRTKVGDGNLRLGRSEADGRFFYSLSHAGAGFLRAPLVAEEFAEFVLNGTRGRFTGIVTRH